MDQNDVDSVVKYHRSMIGSDGLFFDEFPHPRLYGTFPRILSYYVREKKILSLSEAISKMTSLPARKFKLHNRGLLKIGYYADIVVFSPDTIHDAATFQSPKNLAEGIHYVFTNGKLVYSNGEVTKARPGKIANIQQ